MGMTSEECLKASVAFELFLFCLKLSREYLKVVEIKFKYKLRLENVIFYVSFHLHLFCSLYPNYHILGLLQSFLSYRQDYEMSDFQHAQNKSSNFNSLFTIKKQTNKQTSPTVLLRMSFNRFLPQTLCLSSGQ